MKQKLHIVAAQHGDEAFGLKVIGKMQARGNSRCSFRVGHPEAVAKRVRYIETDLNRSYGRTEQSLESRIADSIMAEIYSIQPDLIIDIHTSVSDVDKVAIIAEHSDRLIKLSDFIGTSDVVIIPSQITQGSLIGQFSANSISLEFGKNKRSDKLAINVAKKLEQISGGEVDTASSSDGKANVFEVTGTIDKDFVGLNSIVNLKFNSALGGYPFLAGSNTYKDIGGFLAKKVN